jgi:hypothetical protein
VGNSPVTVPDPVDPVETALVDALTKASAAERFDLVAQLADEVQARRLARAGVPSLPPRTARRNR